MVLLNLLRAKQKRGNTAIEVQGQSSGCLQQAYQRYKGQVVAFGEQGRKADRQGKPKDEQTIGYRPCYHKQWNGERAYFKKKR